MNPALGLDVVEAAPLEVWTPVANRWAMKVVQSEVEKECELGTIVVRSEILVGHLVEPLVATKKDRMLVQQK